MPVDLYGLVKCVPAAGTCTVITFVDCILSVKHVIVFIASLNILSDYQTCLGLLVLIWLLFT